MPILWDSAGAQPKRPVLGQFTPTTVLTGETGSGIVSQTAIVPNPSDPATHRNAQARFSSHRLRFGTSRTAYNPHSRTAKH